MDLARTLKAAALCGLAAAAFSCSIAPAAPEKKAEEAPKASVPAVKNTVRLQLPPAIYAVPGVESCIYFDNVVNVINPDNYVFDVTCTKGRNDQKRWRYTPAKTDKGTFPLKLRVFSCRGLEAEGETQVIVTSADAGAGKNPAILVIGDSLTAAGVYPTRIEALMKANGHPEVKMLGLRGTKGHHEGYGGWRWDTFIKKTQPSQPKPGQKFSPRMGASPFIIDGKFSLAGYLKKHFGGRVPDFITLQLGVNDVFGANDDNLEERIKVILENADNLIAALRKDAPDAVIGVGLVTPGAKTQDAFGSNYACGQTRWQYKKNQHALNAAMLKKFADYPDKKVFIVPSNVNLDCENNFPARSELVSGTGDENRNKISRQSNGVHPAAAGYNQMGDTFFCWIKYHLAK